MVNYWLTLWNISCSSLHTVELLISMYNNKLYKSTPMGGNGVGVPEGDP